MKAEDYPLVGSYNNQRITSIDAERSVNCFEYLDALGKKPNVLIQTSGIQDMDLDFGANTGPFRAAFLFNGVVYIVVGDTFYYITQVGANLVLSAPQTPTLGTNSGYIGIDANTFQVIVVDGLGGYIFDTNALTFTKITDASFPATPIDVCNLDGFFVVAVGGTPNFQLSQLNEGLNWGSNAGSVLQQGSITSHPGTIVACKTLHRRLFLFSQFFTEVWENQGIGTTLPFRRNNSFLIELGTPSTGSVAVGFDRMFFLSQDRDGLGSVIQVNGVNAIPVSNRALDFQLAQYIQIPTLPPGQGVADARGFLIKENGLIFYRLNFTTANHTFVYNVSMSDPSNEATMRWHEEEVLNGDRHPAQVHVFFNGSNYYGSYNHPIFYLVDVNLQTNDGEAIRRMRIGKPIVPAGYQRIRIDRFQIDLLQGQLDQDLEFEPETLLTENALDILTEDGRTLETDQVFVINEDEDPKLFFSYSKDGGQSYGTVFTLAMGEVGQRTFRTLIRKLGVVPRGQAFVPKIEFYSDVPFYVLGASWVYEVLPE